MTPTAPSNQFELLNIIPWAWSSVPRYGVPRPLVAWIRMISPVVEWTAGGLAVRGRLHYMNMKCHSRPCSVDTDNSSRIQLRLAAFCFPRGHTHSIGVGSSIRDVPPVLDNSSLCCSSQAKGQNGRRCSNHFRIDLKNVKVK